MVKRYLSTNLALICLMGLRKRVLRTAGRPAGRGRLVGYLTCRVREKNVHAGYVFTSGVQNCFVGCILKTAKGGAYFQTCGVLFLWDDS